MQKGYQSLLVWQKSMELAREIYSLTEKFPQSLYAYNLQRLSHRKQGDIMNQCGPMWTDILFSDVPLHGWFADKKYLALHQKISENHSRVDTFGCVAICQFDKNDIVLVD